MLSWLRSLLAPGRGRVVFRYFDGARNRGADPLRLKAALDKACPEWAAKCAKLAESEQLAASGLVLTGSLAATVVAQREGLTNELIAAAREAFQLPVYAEQRGRACGVTDLEALDTLAAYLAWVAELMGDTRPLVTPPPSTDSAAAGSPSGSGSDSPSTPSGSGESGSGASAGPSAEPSPEGPSTEPDAAALA